jgi:hypothetical protein
MIKIRSLKAQAQAEGLKLSQTALGAASDLAMRIVHEACLEAQELGHPKLEGRHFKSIGIIRVKKAGKGKPKAPVLKR